MKPKIKARIVHLLINGRMVRGAWIALDDYAGLVEQVARATAEHQEQGFTWRSSAIAVLASIGIRAPKKGRK